MSETKSKPVEIDAADERRKAVWGAVEAAGAQARANDPMTQGERQGQGKRNAQRT